MSYTPSTLGSFYQNNPHGIVNSVTRTALISSQAVFPFNMNQNISASYVRFPASFSAVSTSFNTSAGTWTTSFQAANTVWAVFYTLGTGANSQSLQYVTSASVGWTAQASFSGSNSSNYSASLNVTFPILGTTSSTQNTFASTTATVVLQTSVLSRFTGSVNLDIPFATSLGSGNYWMALLNSTATTGGQGFILNASTLMNSNINSSIKNFNDTTPLPWVLGAGVYTNAGSVTTSSIGLAQIQTAASQPQPFFQIIRQV